MLKIYIICTIAIVELDESSRYYGVNAHYLFCATNVTMHIEIASANAILNGTSIRIPAIGIDIDTSVKFDIYFLSSLGDTQVSG